MIRHGLTGAAAAAAFVLAFYLARPPAPSPPSSQPRVSADAQQSSTSPASGFRRRDAQLPSYPIPSVRVLHRSATPYEELILDKPESYFALKMALQPQLVADKHLTRRCFASEVLVGKSTLEFAWWVESRARHAKASGLRFVQVHDGVAIPAHAGNCVAQSLAGTYEALADGIPFVNFTGEIPIRLAWTFSPASSTRGERPLASDELP